MRTLVLASLILLTFHSAYGLKNSSPTQMLDQQWGHKHESRAKKILMFLPRLVGRPIQAVFAGKFARRIGRTGTGTYHLVRSRGDSARRQKAGYQLADSLVNPGATINDAVSDAMTVLKTTQYAAAPMSTRIKICTVNLVDAFRSSIHPLHFINPTLHVGVLIDGRAHETRDPASYQLLTNALESGVTCTSAPLLDNVSDSYAIEKLMCLDEKYRDGFTWTFWGSNCGAYTRDILYLARIGFAAYPNIGIGYGYYSRNSAAHAEQGKKALAACNTHMFMVREIIERLEQGQEISGQLKAEVGYVMEDTRLQFVVSAARGKHPANRIWATDFTGNSDKTGQWTSVYYQRADPPRLLRKGYVPYLEKMFLDLDEEALAWISKDAPTVSRLYNDLMAAH